MSQDQIWTLKATLDWCTGYLERHGDENPRLSTQWLMTEVTGLSRVELFMNFDRVMPEEELAKLRDFVARRGKGEPLQYITGHAAFRYLSVLVRPGVLIPRPETEVLVSELLAMLPAQSRRVAADSLVNEYDGAALMAADGVVVAAAASNAAAAAGVVVAAAAGNTAVAAAAAAFDAASGPAYDALASDGFDEEEEAEPAELITFGAAAADDCPVDAEPGQSASPIVRESEDAASSPHMLLVADICTGSGCIACSVATEREDTRVIAVDLAPEAVALARDNVRACGIADRVGVLQGDLGCPIETARPQFMGRFDAVVSNPPYIPTAVLDELSSEVMDFEPTLALDGGADGLDLYRRLVEWTMRALKPGGAFACELHETCLDEAARIADAAGMVEVRIVRDLAGRPRVLCARKP